MNISNLTIEPALSTGYKTITERKKVQRTAMKTEQLAKKEPDLRKW